MKTLTKQKPSKMAPIQITKKDRSRLEALIADIKKRGGVREDLTSLLAELDRATTVEAKSIPRNVVTMDSVVSIVDQNSFERMKFTLVFPLDANPDEGRISVLSPIGSAVLGFKVGDEVEWEVPAGIRRFVIAKVDSQPESSIRWRRNSTWSF